MWEVTGEREAASSRPLCDQGRGARACPNFKSLKFVLITTRHKPLLVAKVTEYVGDFKGHSTFIGCVTCKVMGLLWIIQGVGKSLPIE